MSRHPTLKWAQRTDKVYITIELPDAKDVKLKLEPEGKFYFSATSGVDKIPYEIDIELSDKVNVEESKAAIGLRNICYLVKKAENEWWSRLSKKEGKAPMFLKVDWDKWIDEDDEQEDKSGADVDFGGMDFSKLDMGGGGGGDDDIDDDDDGDDDGAADEDVDFNEMVAAKAAEEVPSGSREADAKA